MSRLDELKFHPGKQGSCNHHHRLVFSRFFYWRGNLGIVKEKNFFLSNYTSLVISQNWRFIDFHWSSAVSILFHRIRSSRLQMFFKIGVLKHFTVSIGKHQRWSLFDKIADLKVRKVIPTQVFSCEYWKIFKNTFLAEHLRWLLLWNDEILQRYLLTFFLIDWRHMTRKNIIEISSIYWNVLLWIFFN